jgi:pimeloyl-ACP methyl ester carboxylesterase
MPHAEVNRQRLYYEDVGTGPDAIVLSHGFFMNHAMFEAQVAALRDRWRCVVWDERGHGRTTTSADPFTLWDSARDLLGLMDHLGIERAVLAGMSQGGYLSFRAALLAPERVRALVLMSTQPGVGGGLGGAFDIDALIDEWVAPGGPSQALVDGVAEIILGDAFPDPARWMDAAARIPEPTVRQIFQTLTTREDDVTPRLGELTMPALVLHGSEDRGISVDVARACAAALPAGQLVVIEGAGHAANITHADKVNAHLEAFLSGPDVSMR